MAEVTIPRYAPVTNMVLKYDPEHILGGDTWVGKFVTIPNRPDINFGENQNFTVEVWVKPALVQKWTVNTSLSIVEKWGGDISTTYPYVIRYFASNDPNNGGKVIAARFIKDVGNPSIASSNRIDDGQFHYVVFLKMGKMLYLYVDGKPENPTEDIPGATGNISPLFIGMRGEDQANPSYFTGEIGQVRIWNKALAPEKIAEIYQKAYPVQGGYRDGNSLLAEGLVGDWRFNEGYGALAFDYARSNNGVLGGGVEDNKPEWTVSTILRQPTFIVDPLPSTKQAVVPPEEAAPFSSLTLNALLLRARAVAPPVEEPPESAPVGEAAPLPESEAPPEVEVESGPAKVRAKTKATKTRARTARRAKR